VRCTARRACSCAPSGARSRDNSTGIRPPVPQGTAGAASRVGRGLRPAECCRSKQPSKEVLHHRGLETVAPRPMAGITLLAQAAVAGLGLLRLHTRAPDFVRVPPRHPRTQALFRELSHLRKLTVRSGLRTWKRCHSIGFGLHGDTSCSCHAACSDRHSATWGA
jgi:hypothetical protein